MEINMPDFDADFYQRHNELLREVFRKAINEDDALSEGNLLYLLSEGELDQPDVEALRSSTAELKSFLAEMMGVEEINSKLPSIAVWLKAQGRNVQAAEKFVAKLDLNEPKGAKDWVKSVFGKGFTVANGVAAVALIDSLAFGGLKAIEEAAALIKRNLDGKLPDNVKLVAVPSSTGITKEDIAAGIKKAFQKSLGNEGLKDAKGFMKKLGGKAAKIPDVKLTEFPVDNVMPELMELTLPELTAVVESFAGKIPTPDETAVDDALANADSQDAGAEVDTELSTDQIGKAGQAWLDKLQADGADAGLMKLGKQWMAAVSKDPDFKKIAGLAESYNTSLTLLLLEQVKWPDVLNVFAKNAPGALKGVDAKTIEPLIAPFAQALADQGVEVVDKSGNPYKPPVDATDDVIEDIEEDLPADEEADSSLDGLIKKLSGIKGILKPEVAAQKISDLFGLAGGKEKVVEEGHRWSLYDLLAEEVVKYADVVKALSDHLPSGDADKIEVIAGIHNIISTDFGKDFGIAEIPEPPADSDDSEAILKLRDARKQLELVPDGLDVDEVNKVAADKIASDLGIEAQLAADLLDPAKELADVTIEIPSETKKGGVWIEKVLSAAGARINGWIKKGLGSIAEEFGKLESEYGEGTGDAVVKFIEQTIDSVEDVDPGLKAGFLEKIGEGLQDPQYAVGTLVSLVDYAGLGEDEVKELLPQKLANAVLEIEDEEPEEGEIAIEKIYEYTNSKGEKIFVKVTEENPKEGWWQAVKLGKDGKSWQKPTQAFAAKEASFGEEVDEASAFGGGTGQKIKTKDFNSKISAAIDNVYGDDDELLDLIIDDQEKVPSILAKVSKELFADDFALEESLYGRRLLPFLFEGSYVWSDVQKIIDKHAEDVPMDLLYAIFAKAVPSFKELGVEVSGVPEPDIEKLKAVLSGEEIDPNAELDIEDPSGVSPEEEKKMDAEAQKVAGGLGAIPIDKNKLAAILKKHPDIVGQGQKSTRARRKLRKAINMAAGMEVFAEEFDYGSVDKDKYILKESNESEAVARWRTLAGIKND